MTVLAKQIVIFTCLYNTVALPNNNVQNDINLHYVSEIIKALHNVYHTGCISIIYSREENILAFRDTWLLFKQWKTLLYIDAYLTLAEYTTFNYENQCKRNLPLHVILSEDSQLKKYVMERLHITNAKWLLFLSSNASLEEKFNEINIPINREVFVAQMLDEVVYVTEVYRIHPTFPLEIHGIGNWSISDGLHWISSPFYKRRGNLKGLEFKGIITKTDPLTAINRQLSTISKVVVVNWASVSRQFLLNQWPNSKVIGEFSNQQNFSKLDAPCCVTMKCYSCRSRQRSFCSQGQDTTPKSWACRFVYVVSFLTVRRPEMPFYDLKGLLSENDYSFYIARGSLLDYFRLAVNLYCICQVSGTNSPPFNTCCHPHADSLFSYDEETHVIDLLHVKIQRQILELNVSIPSTISVSPLKAHDQFDNKIAIGKAVAFTAGVLIPIRFIFRAYRPWSSRSSTRLSPEDVYRSSRRNVETDFWEPEDEWGNLVNGSWRGMIRNIVVGQADVAVAAFSFSADRLSSVDFLPPIISTSAMLYIQKPNIVMTDWTCYFMPFHLYLWISIIGAMFVLATTLTAVSYFGYTNVTSEPQAYSFSDSFLYVFGSFCAQGQDSTPRSWACRFVYIISFMVGMVLSAAYSGALISFLASPRPQFFRGTFKLLCLWEWWSIYIILHTTLRKKSHGRNSERSHINAMLFVTNSSETKVFK
ncbi:hypothetical protein L9F63_020505, partial [Diploptera punctata]